MEKDQRVYYKIRLLDNIGKYNEWHSSNNGTCKWNSLGSIKTILTRGVQSGYKGKFHSQFENYEVVKITEFIKVKKEVINL